MLKTITDTTWWCKRHRGGTLQLVCDINQSVPSVNLFPKKEGIQRCICISKDLCKGNRETILQRSEKIYNMKNGIPSCGWAVGGRSELEGWMNEKSHLRERIMHCQVLIQFFEKMKGTQREKEQEVISPRGKILSLRKKEYILSFQSH